MQIYAIGAMEFFTKHAHVEHCSGRFLIGVIKALGKTMMKSDDKNNAFYEINKMLEGNTFMSKGEILGYLNEFVTRKTLMRLTQIIDEDYSPEIKGMIEVALKKFEKSGDSPKKSI